MISLMYPKGYCKSANTLSRKTAEELELDYIAMLICPHNTDFALSTLTELITDEKVTR